MTFNVYQGELEIEFGFSFLNQSIDRMWYTLQIMKFSCCEGKLPVDSQKVILHNYDKLDKKNKAEK